MTDLLTAEERKCLDVSGELAWRLKAVIGEGPTSHGDWCEAAAAIHVLQRMVMGNAAARSYPTEYRLLGQRIRQPEPTITIINQPQETTSPEPD